ncbi:O-antigen ligase family protein [Thermodesulfobacteriota bacterium]
MNQPVSVAIETRPPIYTSKRVLFYFITAAIGLSYILIMSQWDYSLHISSGEMPEEMPGIIGINNMQGALGKALLGTVGIVLLLLPSNYNRHYRVGPLFFFVGYLSLCYLSFIWSAHTEQTVRRLLVLGIYIVGILGTVRHLSSRQLLDSAIVVSLIIISLGLVVELNLGTFTPLQSSYRFTGTMHPNSQGSICAILVLASYCRLRDDSNKWIFWATLFIGILFLFLTKSRSNIFSCILALYLSSFWNTSPRSKQLLFLLPFTFVCMSILTISFSAPELLARFDLLVNFGRDLDTADIFSLHGRIPLWVSLKDYILQRPLLGFGYHGFWTADMMAFYKANIMTWANSGHSVIIDLLLQVGVIGTLLYGFSVLSVLYWVMKDCSFKGRPEDFFTFAILVQAIVLGLLESILLTPHTFGAFVTSVALFNCCIIKENKSITEVPKY